MEWTWSISALFFSTLHSLPFILLFIGVLIGLILGLTGSGGSLVAVPLLVVLLSIELSVAIGISLAVVAFSAVIGVFHHLKLGSIVWLPTIVFAVVGSALTPLGYQLGQYFTPLLITVFFSVLTSVIAIVMWKKTHSNNTVLRANTLLTQVNNTNEVDAFPLTMTWKTIGATMIAAALTGVLSGLLGVGGGFIIVPALTLLLKMNMRQAVASSLVIISVVSSVGFSQYLILTPIINTHFMSYLMVGSAVGMGLGIFLSRYITGQKLQKIFAITMVVMAFVMLLKNSG